MANKLAGQRAKYTKALAEYSRTEDEVRKQSATRRMLEVIDEAPVNGFNVAEVTGDQDVPGEVQLLLNQEVSLPRSPPENPDQLVAQLEQMVDTSDLHEEGSGDQFVYAYGYRCAPDRLKVGRTDADVITRITRQITTGTPDRPCLFLTLRTCDGRALEMALHGVLRLHRRRAVGDGDEWFLTTKDELLTIFRQINGFPTQHG